MQGAEKTPFRAVPRRFFEPSAEKVAPALLGKWLVRNTPSGVCGGPIVETEAYVTGDPACHAYVGRTSRNRSMWGPAGHAYVYLIYGFHFCVNTVCRPEGIAEAVLIRAIEATAGVEIMHRQRPGQDLHGLTNGPGKLCAALQIDRTLDGVDLCDADSPLFIADSKDATEFLAQAGPVVTTIRIGITKAADLPLRFYLANSPFISRGAKKARSGERRRPGST